MRTLAIAVALALGAAGQVWAQNSGTSNGKLSAIIQAALAEAARGNCSEQLMEPLLRFQCQQTMGQMNARLQQLGEVRSLAFQGMQQTAGGPAEAWVVQHENGQMFWLAAMGADGKLMTLWSPG